MNKDPGNPPPYRAGHDRDDSYGAALDKLLMEQEPHKIMRYGDQLDGCELHRRTPYVIAPVIGTQFSIARHTMAIKFNGDHYLYVPPTDELVRDDVMRWVHKKNKAAKQPTKKEQNENERE